MSVKTYPDAPYYDDYDPKKQYVQVLARAGNYSQSREFSQIGTMVRDQIGNLGDAILLNGQIITGCDLVISDKVAIMQPGRIWLDGLVRVIYDPISCSITGEGVENIGVKIEERVVTAVEDVTLRNPAVGTEGYLQEGASRVQQVVKLYVNDVDAVSLYTLVDGEIYVETVQQDDNGLTTINGLLAKRTYDTSGNFKVDGLDIMNKETSDGTSQVYISAGSGYIYGVNVRFDSMRSIPLTIPTEFRTCYSEPKVYISLSDKLYFVNNPIKRVIKVTSRVTVTREITRGTIGGGTDELPDQPVREVLEVVAGSKVYTSGVDYTLVGNSIDWSPFGEEPASGTTYDVTYIYLRTNIADIDYAVLGSGTEQYIQFLSDGVLPNPNSEVLVDYEFYLSRMDTLCLDRNSEVSVIEGVSDREDLCLYPINNDTTKLTLGYVLSYANSTKKKIINIYSRRLTQEELNNLRRRVDDVEMNQAQKDLDDEAKVGEDATTLKGIYTDGFVGYTKADITHPEWDCSIDIDMQEMTVGYDTGVVKLSMNEDTSSANVLGRIVSSPYNLVLVQSQPRATSRFLVNPYAVYDREGLCKLDPAVDNWIDENRITINNSTSEFGYTYNPSGGAHRRTTTTFTRSTESVKETILTYMRSIQITVEGSNFEPGEDNIECYFNETRATILNPSIEGASDNTVKANSKGRFSFRITVPEGTPCGSVEVKVKGPMTSGKAVFTSEGVLRNITTTNTRVTRTTENITPGDPLAQTFQFDKDTVLLGIDIFFAAKDLDRSCIIEVRNVVNGYPGSTVYAKEELRPEDITVNGDIPVATRINLSQPVYCEANTQYSFVVKSDSNAYEVWQATMGETDVVTGSKVSSQPHKDGLMFSSSNGIAWTAHQMSDLTFNLYKAEYTGRGEVIFDNVSSLDFNKILLAAETEDHKNAGIEWSYKINSSSVWEPIDTYVGREMEEEGNSFSLRAIINVSQSTSPLIANDCINLVYFKNKLKATYVSRMVEFEEEFTNIKVSVEVALPTGCTVKVYYMLPDKSDVWVPMSLDGESVKVDTEFNRNTYKATGVSANQYRVKVELETTNPLNRPRARKLMSILKY